MWGCKAQLSRECAGMAGNGEVMDSLPEVLLLGEMHRALLWLTAAAFPHSNPSPSAAWSCFPPAPSWAEGAHSSPKGSVRPWLALTHPHLGQSRGALRRRESS